MAVRCWRRHRGAVSDKDYVPFGDGDDSDPYHGYSGRPLTWDDLPHSDKLATIEDIEWACKRQRITSEYPVPKQRIEMLMSMLRARIGITQ